MTREQHRFLYDQRGSRLEFLNIQSNPIIQSNELSIQSNLNPATSVATNTSVTKKRTISGANKSHQLSLDENSNLSIPDNQGVVLRSRNVDYTDEKANSKTYNTNKYPQVALVADRLNLTNRQTAQICNALLTDVGMLSSSNKTNALGAKKIDDARKRERELRLNESSFDDVQAVYCDGRKDETFEIINGARTLVQKEHISFVAEPGSFFIGHKTPSSGHSREVLKVLNEIITEKSIEINNIKAIGCDGTNVNTGHNGGIIRLFEIQQKNQFNGLFVCSMALSCYYAH